MISLPCVKSS